MFTIVISAGFIISVSLLPESKSSNLDNSSVNDIVKTYEKNWDKLIDKEYIKVENQKNFTYAVIDVEGNILEATDKIATTSIFQAISHRDTIIDLMVSDKLVGKVIIYNEMADDFALARKDIIVSLLGTFLFIFLLCVIYYLYLNKTILKPFLMLKQFAGRVAMGNLEVPVTMDRNNLFGAFTESFDIMREELKKARESERRANESKKELIAKLSHDIKTPVASIKAISELMSVQLHKGKEKERLDTIGAKADQIDLLISNMFHATLEELKELKITIAEEPSSIIEELVKASDYEQVVSIEPIPQCLIVCDKLRLEQVIDNVISNAYKYAGTKIIVKGEIVTSKISANDQLEEELVITIRDYGKGVGKEELPLLFEKYYRGEDGLYKSGTGLGLYISKYLMENMKGSISCENYKDGFGVILTLSLQN
jgi:signal transduction histidine kinase